MHLFDYRCEECGHVFEELVESREAQVACPSCASQRARRQLSAFSIGRGGAVALGDAGPGPSFGGGCAGGMCGI